MGLRDLDLRRPGPIWALAAGLGLLLAALWGARAAAQVELLPTASPVNAAPQVLEPGAGVAMVQSASAELGDGVVVFEFEIQDVDPLVDDNEDVVIEFIEVHNLGSAPCEDFAQLGLLDESDNFIGLGPGDPALDMAAECFPGDGPITWGVELDLSGDPLVVPDDQARTVRVVLRVADTTRLGARAQDHTVQLRVVLHFRERVGSPPQDAAFTASITDPEPDRVWNGGVNVLLPIGFSPRPIPLSLPGRPQSGPVAAFQVCDEDANDHPLRVAELLLKQGLQGNARAFDLQGFRLLVDGAEHASLSAPLSSDFDRGGAGLPWTVNVDVPDEGCRTFEIWAVTAQGAMLGRTIQLTVKLFAEEPVGWPLDARVAPVYESPVTVMIGSGALRLPTLTISGVRSRVPLEVLGVPAGLGALELCDKGIAFDPGVLTVEAVVPAAAYEIQTGSLRIDNRSGRVCFTLQRRPGAEPARGLDRPERVAELIVSARDAAQFGKESALLLQPVRVLDANDQDITEQVLVISGRVTLALRGDLDGDGKPTVRDALLLALELLNGCPNLDDELRLTADVVVSPGAPRDLNPEAVPTCRPMPDPANPDRMLPPDLDSADVVAIARMALAFGFDGATGAAAAPGSASAALLPLQVRSLRVLPIKSARTPSFALRVEGQGVRAVALTLFDLSGRERLTVRGRGGALTFSPQDAHGRSLANGVYLYVVRVEGYDGRVWRSGVKKLVVLR